MSDIFISYKREDQPIARKLADALEREGWSVWWDPKLRAGEHFDDVIEAALGDSKCIIVVWSAASLQSRYVRDEATYALERNKLVPVAIENVDLSFRFKGVHTLRLLNWDGSNDAMEFRKLVEDIAVVIGNARSGTLRDESAELEQTRVRDRERQQLQGHQGLRAERGENAQYKRHKRIIYGGCAAVIIVLATFVILRFRYSLTGGVKVPEMVVIPAGTFGMGEHRQRKVTVHKPFAIGRHEVTFDEYDLFAKGSGWELPPDSGWGRDRRPVINVAWSDAQAYAAWLSKKTGKRYRLPTEVEWEYAARSRGKNEIWAGTSEPGEVGIYAVFDMLKTDPVGSRKPNSIGLYDMSGNVFEWVQDCWHESYTGAPTDGASWLEANGGDCSLRVMRGGSWNLSSVYLQASARNRLSAVGRVNYVGFRLAQDLD